MVSEVIGSVHECAILTIKSEMHWNYGKRRRQRPSANVHYHNNEQRLANSLHKSRVRGYNFPSHAERKQIKACQILEPHR